MKSFSQDRLRDYSALFSRAEVLSWQKGDFCSVYKKIGRYDKDWLDDRRCTYKDYLKYVYGILEKNYINEYVVKNSYLTEVLIPEVKHHGAVIHNEFRVGKSIADLAMFNGTSKVFEIKTEFDSDNRLELQLESYGRIFNEVYLIIPESKVSYYNKVRSSIGLITYNVKNAKDFAVIRQAELNGQIEVDAVMDILHTNEYKSIVKDYFGALPNMTSFNQFELSKQLFFKMPITEVNRLFIFYMKKRKMSADLSSRYHKELNQLILALKLERRDKISLINNLNNSITY